MLIEDFEIKVILGFFFFSFGLGVFFNALHRVLVFHYTLFLMVVGMSMGIIEHNTKLFEKLVDLRTSETFMMTLIFPTIIFHTAFSIDQHVFQRAFVQVLILSIPGILINVSMMSIYANGAINLDIWTWSNSLTLATMVSIPDAVAIIGVVKETGSSIFLSAISNGESLFSAGIGFLVFNMAIFRPTDLDYSVQAIVTDFIMKMIGGPLLGFSIGKIAMFWISYVHNDQKIEMAVILALAYIVFYVGEVLIRVSGVLATVTFSIYVNVNRDSITPAVEPLVQSLWNVFYIIVNAFIYFFSGLQLSLALFRAERADAAMVLMTFCVSIISRLAALGILTPFLARTGYGIHWQHIVIFTWCAVKGSYSLSMVVLCHSIKDIIQSVEDKIIIHSAGVVFLGSLFGFPTTRKLFDMLALTEVSRAKKESMGHAVMYLNEVRVKSTHVQKMNQFLTDANWEWIAKRTTIKNPYTASEGEVQQESEFALRKIDCPFCSRSILVQPTEWEIADLKREAISRALKAFKAIVWRQFDHGLIQRQTLKNLISLADNVSDKGVGYVDHTEVLNKMEIPRQWIWIKKKLENAIKKEDIYDEFTSCETVKDYIQYFLHHIAFDITINMIIFLNIITIFLDDAQFEKGTIPLFDYGFLLLYNFEATIKIYAADFGPYWENKWNKLDYMILVTGVFETYVDLLALYNVFEKDGAANNVMINIRAVLRGSRILRLLKLLSPLLNRAMEITNSQLRNFIQAAYDMGHGFVISEEEIMNNIEFMVSYLPIALEMKDKSNKVRLEIVKKLLNLQKTHPGVAVSIKTKLATRKILNDAKRGLSELKSGGLIDENEFLKLDSQLNDQILNLAHAASSETAIVKPSELLDRVEWVQSKEIIDYLQPQMEIVNFNNGDIIVSKGQETPGIYIIASGIIKVAGEIQRIGGAILPNVDTYVYFEKSDDKLCEDFVSSCHTLGLLGMLTNGLYVTEATCETEILAVFLPATLIREALTLFQEPPSLLYQMWKMAALKIGVTILLEQPHNQNIGMEKIKMRAEKAIVPNLVSAQYFHITHVIEEVVLVQGRARSEVSGDSFRGPCYVPRTAKNVFFPGDPKKRVLPILVIIASDRYTLPKAYDWSGSDSVPKKMNLPERFGGGTSFGSKMSRSVKGPGLIDQAGGGVSSILSMGQ